MVPSTGVTLSAHLSIFLLSALARPHQQITVNLNTHIHYNFGPFLMLLMFFAKPTITSIARLLFANQNNYYQNQQDLLMKLVLYKLSIHFIHSFTIITTTMLSCWPVTYTTGHNANSPTSQHIILASFFSKHFIILKNHQLITCAHWPTSSLSLPSSF